MHTVWSKSGVFLGYPLCLPIGAILQYVYGFPVDPEKKIVGKVKKDLHFIEKRYIIE